MKLILFLGSGISIDSGLPRVDKLLTDLFTAPYYCDGLTFFSPGESRDPDILASDTVPRVRQVLRLLEDHDQQDINIVGYSPSSRSSSGALFRSKITTYEDLFYLCSQLKLWHNGLVDNSLVTPLMEKIETVAGDALRGDDKLGRMSDLASLAQSACYLIESVVADKLKGSGSIAGLDLILELAKTSHIEQLNIVTLNHDTLVEQFLDDNSVVFVDGFGEPDGDVRWYEETLYDSEFARVRIFKLHGSVNWYSFYVDGRSRPAIFIGNDVAQIKNNGGAELESQSRRPSFLSGLNKESSYQRGIYVDLHFHFHQLLHECNRMVMSGYGWGDLAINNRLEAWMDHDQKNSITLLHRYPEELQERSLAVASSYDGWVNSGQLISIPKWLSEVHLKDLKI